MSSLPPLIQHLPPAGAAGAARTPDAIVDGFIEFVADQGLSLYDAQEEAILELLAGNNVILNTPTGSGKSLVAAAAHFAALAADKRSVYTAPIKALVSEKFFALRRDFGADLVGMITGDASDQPRRSDHLLHGRDPGQLGASRRRRSRRRRGHRRRVPLLRRSPAGLGMAGPLLELPDAQFLLMSATLGNDRLLREGPDEANRPTNRHWSVGPASGSARLRVPATTLHHSIAELLASGRAPIYLVHFTQREATEAAQGYLSLDPLTKDREGAGQGADRRVPLRLARSARTCGATWSAASACTTPDSCRSTGCWSSGWLRQGC